MHHKTEFPSSRELSIRDVLSLIWQERRFVSFVAFSFFIAAALYLYTVRPSYTVQAAVGPSSTAEIGLNIIFADRFKLYLNNKNEILPNPFFEFFVNILTSPSTSWRYVLENEKDQTIAHAQASSFQDGFFIKQDKKSKITYLNLQGVDKKNMQQDLSSYIVFAHNLAKKDLADQLRRVRETRISEITALIEGMMKNSPIHRQEIQAQLKEAARIARSLRLEEPLAHIFSSKREEKELLFPETQFALIYPFYMGGYKALEAELGVLQERKSDLASLSKISILYDKISALKNLEIKDIQSLSLYKLELPPTPPRIQILSSPSIVLSLFLFIGLLVGIAGVLLRRASFKD